MSINLEDIRPTDCSTLTNDTNTDDMNNTMTCFIQIGIVFKDDYSDILVGNKITFSERISFTTIT